MTGPYSAEFRRRAVELARANAGPIAHVAKDLGVSPSTLRTWLRREDGGRGNSDEQVSPAEQAPTPSTEAEQGTARQSNNVGTTKQRPRAKSVFSKGAEVAAFILLAIGAALIGFYIKPATPAIPPISASSPAVELWVNSSGIQFTNVKSDIDTFPGSETFYTISGTAWMPPGSVGDLQVEIIGMGHMTSSGGSEPITNYVGMAAIWRPLHPGSNDFSYSVISHHCSCVTYASPYLVAATPDILVATGMGSEKLPTITYASSELTDEQNGLPTDWSIVSGTPEIPETSDSPAIGWIWPNSGYGSLVAEDLSASANLNARTFYAGIALGLAGAAAIGALQAAFRVREPSSRSERRRA